MLVCNLLERPESPEMIVPASPAQAVGVDYYYYENYFRSAETCKARGKALTKPGSFWFGFLCLKDQGDPK